jgi:hypothetical protein
LRPTRLICPGISAAEGEDLRIESDTIAGGGRIDFEIPGVPAPHAARGVRGGRPPLQAHPATITSIMLDILRIA